MGCILWTEWPDLNLERHITYLEYNCLSCDCLWNQFQGTCGYPRLFITSFLQSTGQHAILPQNGVWEKEFNFKGGKICAFLVLLVFFHQSCLFWEHRFHIARAQRLIYSMFLWLWFSRGTASLLLAFHRPLPFALGGLFVGELELDEEESEVVSKSESSKSSFF